MSELFQAPATIESVRTLVDGGVKLAVNTQEMGPDDLAELFSLRGKLGWFLFKENEIELPDIPTDGADAPTGAKTPSERLRAIIFVYWKECTSQKETFNSFYDRSMESIINRWKEQLPPAAD